MKRSAWILLAVSLPLVGCFHTRVPPGPTLNFRLLGFQTFPTPRTFDSPGTVFRIAPDHTRFPVTQLDVPVEEVGDERFADYSTTFEWSLGAVLKFLGAEHLLSDAEISPTVSSTLATTLLLGRGERERTYDADVAAALKAASLEYRDGSRYYVIRETIAVSEMGYRFTRASGSSSAVNLGIEKAVSTAAALKWANAARTELVQTFDRPHRVFYTAEEIVPPTGLVALEPLRRPVTEPLQWTTEQH